MNAAMKMRNVARGPAGKKASGRHLARRATNASGATVPTITAAIVHEVNQPLTALLINAEAALRWLMREPPNINGAKLAIERLIGNGHRAVNTTRIVRDLIKQSPLQVGDLNISDVIREALTLVNIYHKKIVVETDFTEPLPSVQGDRSQLERLIINLVANGIEAMCAVEDRRRVLRVNTKPSKVGYILVEVIDTGPGLDGAERERIFQPFYSTKKDGLGLGLWLCRSIATRHGGRLWVDRNTPHGSVFRFTLPCSPE